MIVLMERVTGIEPVSSAWKADIISHYTIPAFLKNKGELSEIYTSRPAKARSEQSERRAKAGTIPAAYPCIVRKISKFAQY